MNSSEAFLSTGVLAIDTIADQDDLSELIIAHMLNFKTTSEIDILAKLQIIRMIIEIF